MQLSPNKTVLCDIDPILYRTDPNGNISVIDIEGYTAKASKVTPYTELKGKRSLDGLRMGYILHKTTCPNYKGKRGKHNE